MADVPHLPVFLEHLQLPVLVLDVGGSVGFANDALVTLLGLAPGEIVGTDWIDGSVPEPERAGLRAAFVDAMMSGRLEPVREYGIVTADGQVRRLEWTSVVLRDTDGAIAGLASVASDVSAVHRLEAHAALMTAAAEESHETTVITDARDRILFVNAAFERATGYGRDAVIGQTAHELLRTDRTDEGDSSALTTAKASGLPWSGEVHTRRSDGSVMTEEVRLRPIHGANGQVTNFITLARDVTKLRALELTIRDNTRERLEIADALRSLEPMASLEATATAICGRLIQLSGVDFAAVYAFEGPADAIVLAEANSPCDPGMQLPTDLAARLRDRAAAGPWAESSANRPSDELFMGRLVEERVAAQAFGPITTDGHAVGLLVIGTMSASYATHLAEQLPAIAEFGAISSALLGKELLERRTGLAERLKIQQLLTGGRFSSVFQPIVEMGRGHIIGYEALARFADGLDPEAAFASAHLSGLGPALEAATLRTALAASDALATGPWLGLNVSPEFVLSLELPEILQGRTRPIVLEITEHRAIEDYQAIHEAVARLGPDVRIAVDDAGSGMANFNHIIGLGPDFVKLDKSLVQTLDTDVARRALVAGLKYFARTLGIYLIAEGVETEAELAALRSLDILLGQGYLLGRPTSAAESPGLRSAIVPAVHP